jgi:hypothetical protein
MKEKNPTNYYFLRLAVKNISFIMTEIELIEALMRNRAICGCLYEPLV